MIVHVDINDRSVIHTVAVGDMFRLYKEHILQFTKSPIQNPAPVNIL